MLAETLRDKEVLNLISTDPGVYKWYMPQTLVDLLKIPIDGCQYKDGFGYTMSRKILAAI